MNKPTISFDEILDRLEKGMGLREREPGSHLDPESQERLDKHLTDVDARCMCANAQDALMTVKHGQGFFEIAMHLAREHKVEQACVLMVELIRYLCECQSHIERVEQASNTVLFGESWNRAHYGNELKKWIERLAELRKEKADRAELLKAAAASPN